MKTVLDPLAKEAGIVEPLAPGLKTVDEPDARGPDTAEVPPDPVSWGTSPPVAGLKTTVAPLSSPSGAPPIPLCRPSVLTMGPMDSGGKPSSGLNLVSVPTEPVPPAKPECWPRLAQGIIGSGGGTPSGPHLPAGFMSMTMSLPAPPALGMKLIFGRVEIVTPAPGPGKINRGV